MKVLKFILGWALLTLFLLAAVLVLPLIESCMDQSPPVQTAFSETQVLYGVAGEIARALLLLLLFKRMQQPGRSLKESIVFGLLTSGLVWTLWVVYGCGTFHLPSKIAFFLEESAVFLIQGLLSGVALHFIFKWIFKRVSVPSQ